MIVGVEINYLLLFREVWMFCGYLGLVGYSLVLCLGTYFGVF